MVWCTSNFVDTAEYSDWGIYLSTYIMSLYLLKYLHILNNLHHYTSNIIIEIKNEKSVCIYLKPIITNSEREFTFISHFKGFLLFPYYWIKQLQCILWMIVRNAMNPKSLWFLILGRRVDSIGFRWIFLFYFTHNIRQSHHLDSCLFKNVLKCVPKPRK